MTEQEKNELVIFEKTLKEYVKEFNDTWRVDTPYHTTRYWTFVHKDITYLVSRVSKSFSNEVSYLLSQELGKTLYYGISKQDLFSKITEIMRS